MTYTVLTRAPAFDDYEDLSEHLQRTPGSFFGGRPVLHLQCPRATVLISSSDLQSQPDFAALAGQTASDGTDVSIQDIDVWVTSQHITLFAPVKSHGLQIPYPTITIHAQDGPRVLLELNLSDQNTADEDLEFLQLRILPTATATHQTRDADAEVEASTASNEHASPAQQLYEAISACQELNPDPPSDDEEGEGFDETAPGATGWITSENMGEFVDEEGNFKMPEGVAVIGDEEESGGRSTNGLGEGAGRTRTAAELDAGDGAEEEEGKWQRTS